MQEKISVYIPAYNAENTIKYSLEALFKQSLSPSEITVINDCSSDQTLKILNTFKNNIKNTFTEKYFSGKYHVLLCSDKYSIREICCQLPQSWPAIFGRIVLDIFEYCFLKTLRFFR